MFRCQIEYFLNRLFYSFENRHLPNPSHNVNVCGMDYLPKIVACAQAQNRTTMKTVKNQPAPTASSSTPAGFARRLGAMAYDLLLLIAILMVASAPFVVAAGSTSGSGWKRFVFQLYLLAIIFVYYGWFWVRSGQTLGMLTWKLRVVATDGSAITWRHALKRFAAAGLSLACLGFGFFWIIADRRRLAWHDRLSSTRVVHIR
jgi:uncharacterized RDD family membrane protein YckC